MTASGDQNSWWGQLPEEPTPAAQPWNLQAPTAPSPPAPNGVQGEGWAPQESVLSAAHYPDTAAPTRGPWGTNGTMTPPAPAGPLPPPPSPSIFGDLSSLSNGQAEHGQVSNGVLTQPSAPLPDPPAQEEGWVYVDPSAYSDPYAPQPVYSSGPASAPTASPPPSNYPPPPPPAGSIAGEAPVFAAPGPDGVAGPTDPLNAAGYQPEPGELKIKERRTWKTWQLLLVALLAAGIGMWFNGNAGSASGDPAASGSGSSSYKLGPPPSSTVPAAGSASAAGANSSTTTTAAGSTTTTAPSGSTATTVAGAGAASATATTAPVAVGPATVLVPTTQQTGNWTSPAFTIAGGTWNIGWAFQCAPAPSGGPSFQIFAVTNGSTASGTPAVTSTAASGQSVTPLTSTGSQQVIVQTTAACRWAVKVTGSSS